MTKRIIIVGSASLQDKVQYWKSFWESKGYRVTAYPVSIHPEVFITEYPKVHADFFRHIEEADVVFCMNENQKGLTGYIGAESFAEIAFAVAQKLIHGKKLEVILLQMPTKDVQSYAEVSVWLKLGWIKLFNTNSDELHT